MVTQILELYSPTQPRDGEGRFATSPGSGGESLESIHRRMRAPDHEQLVHDGQEAWVRWGDSSGMTAASEAILGKDLRADDSYYELDEDIRADLGDLDEAPTGSYAWTYVNQARALMQDIRDVTHPTQVPLYRGFNTGGMDPSATAFVAGLDVGDTFDLPLSTWSPDEGLADGFGNVVFRAAPGVKAIPGSPADVVYITDPRSGRQMETNWEWLTTGRFKVTGMKTQQFGAIAQTTIDVEQQAVFDPDTGELV